MEYVKTEISDFLSVRSIESVWNINLANVKGGSESHDFPELFYVEQGMHTTYLDGIPYSLSEGQLIIYAPNAYHCGEPGVVGNATVSIIGFEAEHFDISAICNRIITLTEEQRTMLKRVISMGTEMFVKLDPSSGLVGMRLRDGVTNTGLQKMKHMLELFLIDVFGADEPCAASSDNRTNYKKEQYDRILTYMESRLDSVLTLEDIAESCAMSVSKLSMLFREQAGCGVIAHFNGMKIERAKRLIRESSMNFTEISQSLGFGTVHYFSKLFKKTVGMTPSEYAHGISQSNF